MPKGWKQGNPGMRDSFFSPRRLADVFRCFCGEKDGAFEGGSRVLCIQEKGPLTKSLTGFRMHRLIIQILHVDYEKTP